MQHTTQHSTVRTYKYARTYARTHNTFNNHHFTAGGQRKLAEGGAQTKYAGWEAPQGADR